MTVAFVLFFSPTQIKMNMEEMIAVARPHLLDMYCKQDMPGLFKELLKNEYVVKLGIVPRLSSEVVCPL